MFNKQDMPKEEIDGGMSLGEAQQAVAGAKPLAAGLFAFTRVQMGSNGSEWVHSKGISTLRSWKARRFEHVRTRLNPFEPT